MWLAVEVEALARQYHGCLQIGKPRLLSKKEIKNVLAGSRIWPGREIGQCTIVLT